jgi:copper chaperone CopZ
VQRIEGVKSVDSNAMTQSATIVFDDTKTNFEQIKAALLRENLAVRGGPEYK